MTAEAERTDRDAVKECGDVRDADGVPIALYAAERLLAKDPERLSGGRLRVAPRQCPAMALAE
jgi:hypothetical protein